ncbi:MAG: Na(+)-translocating NADH-quinone reductase subunit C [bacterium]
MSNDSIKKTIVVALGVCMVCSILVSTAAVTLNAIQTENKKLDKVKNILLVGDLYHEGMDIKQTYEEKIEPTIIDLSTGEMVPESRFDEVLNIENYDMKNLAAHPEYGKVIPAEKDLAGIKRMPKYMLIYLVKENEHTEKIILPIYGKGLWSTLYGFMALDKDLKTIRGLTFYEHGETPGLGGEVDNPTWKQSWKGKQAFDENGQVKIQVIKGKVDKSRADARYKIDGLSGSTLTTRGVDNLVKFWLGDSGYGIFLKKLQEELI